MQRFFTYKVYNMIFNLGKHKAESEKRKVVALWLSAFSFIAFSFSLTACEDFVTIPSPDTDLVAAYVFKDDATALSTLAAVYSQLSTSSAFSSGGNMSIGYFEGVYADELSSYAPSNSSSDIPPFYLNNVPSTNGILYNTWSGAYKAIYEVNRIIEGLQQSAAVSETAKKQLMGEAYFVRAFCHFYLVNLFDDVPLVTTSDYRVNATIKRSPAADVYARIVADLVQARTLLIDKYPGTLRTRPNKAAATALLARVSLYMKQYAAAEGYATELINDSENYYLEPDLNNVFLKTSQEAIWQLMPAGGNQSYTYEGFYFILLAPPGSSNVALKTSLVNAFEAGDERKQHWIDSVMSGSGLTKWYFAKKYKDTYNTATGNEYSMVLRLAEQYLIRAEARVYLEKLTGANSASADLDTLRSRAVLPVTTATTKETLLTAIEKERRIELFTEWGHRFFDLKRTGRLDAVLAPPVKPNWNSADAVLPLPQQEVLANPNLLK